MRLAPQQHTLLSDLATVTADLLAHDSKIRSKLVTVVRELMVHCCFSMRSLPWGNPNAAFAMPSPPMSEFISGLTTLHKILMGIFRKEQVADVYSRILQMTNAHLPGNYAVLIAHLATTAAASAAAAANSAAAAASSSSGAGVAGGGNSSAAASVNQMQSLPQATHHHQPFDRSVAVQRMGGDLHLLLQQLRSLLNDPHSGVPLPLDLPGAGGGGVNSGTVSGSGQSGGGRSSSPTTGVTASPNNALDAEISASLATSEEALQSMSKWLSVEFGVKGVTAAPHPSAVLGVEKGISPEGPSTSASEEIEDGDFSLDE